MLDTNGSWVTPQWTWENGALHITEPLPCYGERLFRIRYSQPVANTTVVNEEIAETPSRYNLLDVHFFGESPVSRLKTLVK